MKKSKLTSLKYKNKLIKSLLVPTIAILSTASITTIATSCGKNQVNYNYTVTSGSTLLSGTAGKAGEDSKKWELIREDDEIITNGVNWSIEKQGNTDIAYISIRNGKVSWTNKIQKNAYKFVVVAQYEGKQYKSSEITLNINELNYEVSGGSLTLVSAANCEGRDDNKWELVREDYEIITSGVTWSLESAEITELPDSLDIDVDGYVNWGNSIPEGEYHFYVVANFDGVQHRSVKQVTLSISNGYFLGGGNTTFYVFDGEEGQDEHQWKLYRGGIDISNSDTIVIQWKIVSQNDKSLGGIIDINDRYVSWTSRTQVGDYVFKVMATFTSPDSQNEVQMESNDIILHVEQAQYTLKGETSLLGSKGVEDRSKPWKLERINDQTTITSNVSWKLEPITDNLPEQISIDKDDCIRWSNAIDVGQYKFRVVASFRDKEYESDTITLNILQNLELYLKGGSTSLLGKDGEDGSDEKPWELYLNGEKVNPNRWELESTLGEELPDSLAISDDGLISWTSQISPYNLYKFKVVAWYNGKSIKTNEITLTITSEGIIVSGGTEYFQIEENSSGKDNKYWKLTIDGKTIDNGVTYSLESTLSEELPNSLAISDDGLISWAEIKAGNYKFRVKVEYKEDGKQYVCYSKEIIYTVISQDFYLDGGSLVLNGYVSISSSDGKEWKLYTKNNAISPDYNELTWEIEVNSSKLDGVLAIENGHVTWSNFNQEGTYQFCVKCYSKTHLRWATSRMITLQIDNKPDPLENRMIGFEGNKISYYNKFSKSNVDIYLEKKEDKDFGKVEYLATKPVEAAIYQGESDKDYIDYTPIFNFPVSVNVNDSYTSDGIRYSLVYDNEGPTYEKSGINVNINPTEWYSVDMGNFQPLRYLATLPSYGKAKIVVTFQCDSNVSLTIPINSWNTPSVGTPGSFKLPSDISTDTPAVINYDKTLNTYECFLEAQDLSEVQNKFAKFNIIYTYNYGIYSQGKFLINDIKEKIKNVNVVNVETQFEQFYPEVEITGEGIKILATAYVKYSIFLEIEFDDTNPNAIRNDLFSLCNYEESQKDGESQIIVIDKCNFIWYIR